MRAAPAWKNRGTWKILTEAYSCVGQHCHLFGGEVGILPNARWHVAQSLTKTLTFDLESQGRRQHSSSASKVYCVLKRTLVLLILEWAHVYDIFLELKLISRFRYFGLMCNYLLISLNAETSTKRSHNPWAIWNQREWFGAKGVLSVILLKLDMYEERMFRPDSVEQPVGITSRILQRRGKCWLVFHHRGKANLRAQGQKFEM